MTKSVVIFCFICLVLLGCFFLVLSRKTPSNFQGVKSLQTLFPVTPSPTNLPSLLRFHSSLSYLTPNQLQTLQITLTTQTVPDLIQLELGYDPTLLRDVTIEPGDFFPQSEIVLKTINPNNGRISFAIKSKTPLQKTGSVAAYLSFVPNQAQPNQQTRIVFLPKTIMNKGTTDLLLQTEGVQLIFASEGAKIQTF